MTHLNFNDIYNMDCIFGMEKMPKNSVDMIITDPPFAIDFGENVENYNRKKGSVLKGYNEIKKEDYARFTKTWMEKAYKVLKDSGSMYVVSGWTNLKDILAALDDVGFETINHIVWKYQFGLVTSRKYVTSHYHCLYVCKNDKKRKFFPYSRFKKEDKNSKGNTSHYIDKEDVWVIDREYWNGDIKTPTKLPAELIKKFIQYSSEKQDIILDPFLGSSQTAVVSKGLNRQYIGFEIVEDYYNLGKKRLDEEIYRVKEEKPIDDSSGTLW